jgi:hypothetical protein
MAERKMSSKQAPAPVLERTVSDILVAENRSAEPFVKTFTISGENVSKLDLGTLVGIFEIEEKSEDSAYIVNFLASVAKKEYFSNPRRGAIESFEATLHKMNVALTELVKHGNVSWLGKLHGALGILEKNNLHFSVTGEGAILLFRNDTCLEISEGLASPEALEHPLKTFVEISSGRLFPEDTVVFTSPELPALFPVEILIKNRSRFGTAGFRQFLKTALVNELDMAAALVVDLSEAEPRPATKSSSPQKRASKAKLANVFSGQIFAEPARERVSVAAELESRAAEDREAEYTDEKTGHIYVQGEVPVERTAHQAFLEEAFLWGASFWGSLKSRAFRFGRSLRRKELKWQERLAPLGEKVAEKARAQAESLTAKRRKPEENTEAKGLLPDPARSPSPAAPEESRALPSRASAFRSRLTVAASAARKRVHTLSLPKLSRLPSFASSKERLYRLRGKKFFWPVLGAGGLFLLFILFLSLRQQPASSNVKEAPQNTSQGTSASGARLGEAMEVRSGLHDVHSLLHLNGHFYVAEGGAISDLQEGERHPLPDGQKIRFASAMDDLSLLFLYTESGRLYSWSPISKNFAESPLALPEGGEVDGLGTYLTYLYVLDTGKDQIYRYPRTPAGFETSTDWLREEVALSPESLFRVSESIVLAASPDQLSGFFQGRKKTDFEKPALPFELSSLFTGGSGDVYAVDRKEGRILRWNSEGRLVDEYAHQTFKDSRAFSVDEDGRKFLVATEDGRIVSFPFEK